MRNRLLIALLAALTCAVPVAPAGAVGTGNPSITSPAATDALYSGYAGPFVVDFEDAPKATYNYAVFSDSVAGAPKLVAGPYSFTWTGSGGDQHFTVKTLAADPQLRFKVTDGAGHAAQLSFAVQSGFAPHCALVVEPRVRVNASVEKVSGHLSQACTKLGVTSADWKVTHARLVLDYFHFDGNSTDIWSVFDGDPTGSYPIVALSACAGADCSVPQNSPTVTVRRDSRLAFGGSRSGSKVTLRTILSVYSAGANAFRPWAGRNVALVSRTCGTCTWKLLRTLTTNQHGQASYTVTASGTREFRVIAGGTSQVWPAVQRYLRL